MAAHVFNARELLASPLVSRSPSPGSVEDPEEIPDIELEDDQPMAEEEGAAEVITLSSESEEDQDDGGETVTPEVSSVEDETARKARARMAYRSVRRATQGQGRIRLGVTPPTEDPVDMRRFMEARVATLRRFQQMVDARKVADAEAAWQERLARLQEEEEALWAPASEQPEPTHPLARQLPPTPQPPRPTRTPSTPPPQPRTPTPPPQQGECPRYDRQQAWEIPQAHVGQVVRTIEKGGRQWHQQSATWTWPASMETEDEPEARVWEEAEAIPRERAGLHQVRRRHYQGCRGKRRARKRGNRRRAHATAGRRRWTGRSEGRCQRKTGRSGWPRKRLDKEHGSEECTGPSYSSLAGSATALRYGGAGK
ncbi:GM19346 [Drosophila sechellia]|uniref:GM19346 n=1 Tax=Drosophila sechellia TaxID=7238 RepID=B4IMN5_DROSE|nr:GM19346 [Drosophila sechellia]